MEELLLNTPQAEVDSTYLNGIFKKIKGPKDKITYLLKKGDLLSVRRGLYVVSPLYGKLPSTKILANMIYSPSYISLQSSLRYYGIIPEATWGEISVTIKRTNKFSTKFGDFSYHNSSLKDFLWGINLTKIDDNRLIRIASPIKSIYDLIRFQVQNYRGKTFDELFEYIELLRLDLDEFIITKNEYKELTKAHKKYISKFLLQWIERNQLEIKHA